MPAIATAEGVRLAAVADVDLARARALAPDLPAFPGAQELVAARVIDALVVATPADAHVADARIAAAHGLPTLIEKPPATDLVGALELAQLDPAPRLGFNRRFEPGIASLRAATPPSGPLEIDVELRTRASSWRPYSGRDDALLALGPHLIDLVRWISGVEVAGLQAEVSERRARLRLELADDRGVARIACTTTSVYYRERVVVRAVGRRVGAHTAGGVLVGLRARARRGPGSHVLVASLARQLEAFARFVHGGHEPALAAASDGVAVMSVLEAARRSAGLHGSHQFLESPERFVEGNAAAR